MWCCQNNSNKTNKKSHQTKSIWTTEISFLHLCVPPITQIASVSMIERVTMVFPLQNFQITSICSRLFRNRAQSPFVPVLCDYHPLLSFWHMKWSCLHSRCTCGQQQAQRRHHNFRPSTDGLPEQAAPRSSTYIVLHDTLPLCLLWNWPELSSSVISTV